MHFTVDRKRLVKMLEHVRRKLPGVKKKDKNVRIYACSARVFVEANGVLADVAQTLGWVCCQLNALFNPPKIILAGPLVNFGAPFLNALQAAANEFCAETSQTAPVIVDSELGSFNGALGAAALALHKWKPTQHA